MTPKYELVVNRRFPEPNSWHVYVNGKKVARFTSGCLYDVNDVITVNLMEFLLAAYKEYCDSDKVEDIKLFPDGNWVVLPLKQELDTR